MKSSSSILSRVGDVFFVLAVGAIFCYTAWLLIHDEGAKVSGVGRTQVGTITFKNKIAERKPTGQMIWDGLIQNAPVYNDDTIRTATASSAVIHLNNKVEVSVGEDTLVLVNITPEKTKIALSGGVISVNSQAQGQVQLNTRKGDVTLKSGVATLEDSASKVSLSLDSGSAQWAVGNQLTELTAGTSASASENELPSVRELAKIKTPQCGAVVLAPDKNTTVTATWDSVTPGAQWTVLLAKDQDMTQIVEKHVTSSLYQTWTLEPGTYYWKISQALSNDQNKTSKTESGVNWFTVLGTPPTTLVAPVGKTFRYADKPPIVTFSWVPRDWITTYRLEVYKKNDHSKAFFTQTTTQPTMAIDGLAAGSYDWRVFCSLQNRGEFATAFSDLTLKMEKTKPPVIKTAGNGKAIAVSAYALSKGGVLAQWEAVEGADHYEAQLSTDQAGSNIVLKQTTDLNYLVPEKDLSAGTYYLRVSAISGSDHSEASDAQSIQVEKTLPMTPLVPMTNKVCDAETRNLQFRWEDPNQGSHYQLLVTQDKEMTKPAVQGQFTQNKGELTIPNDVGGDLYWKVTLLDDQGHLKAESSQGVFFMPRLLNIPKPLSPKGGTNIDVISNDHLEFSWTSVPDAQYYEVTLFRMAGGLKAQVMNWSLKETKIFFDDFTILSTDAFSWEVRAYTQEGGRIYGQSPIAKAYFRLIQSNPLGAVSVQAWGVY